MKRLLAVILCALLLAGCSTSPESYTPTGNLLGTNLPTQPGQSQQEPRPMALAWYPDRSMNPYTCTDYTNRALFSLIYQGLFSINAQGEAVPILCDSYNVSADRKTWSFHIAPAFFSDGTAITAGDVAASYEAASAGPYYAGRLQHVKSVYTFGETLVLTLDTPMEQLPLLLDIPVVKASQVDHATPLGSGPYQLGEGILRRQAGWWCEATLPTSVDQITLVAVSSAEEIRNAFQQGNVSLICADPGDMDYAAVHVDYELWDCAAGYFLYLGFHENSTVFTTPALRQAVSAAIDRSELSRRFYNNMANPATLPAEPGTPFYSQVLADSVVYNPLLLTEAVSKLPEENRTVTMLLNGGDQPRYEAGQYIAGILESCGLTVKITTVSAADFAKTLKKGKFDLYLGQTRLSGNMDLSAFFASAGTLNYGGMADLALYELSLAALDNIGNYYTLHRQILEDGQLCPLMTRGYVIYARRGVLEGLSPARDNIFYYDLGKTLGDVLVQGE